MSDCRRSTLLVACAAAVVAACHPTEHRCRAAGAEALWTEAETLCAAAFEESGDPATGVALARAYFYREKDDLALAASRRLLSTSRRADALQLVGMIEDRRDQSAAAQASLEEALRLHRAQGNRRQVARDAHGLAGVFWRQGSYRPAIEAVLFELEESAAARDRPMNGYAYVALGRLLGSLGDGDAAERALQRAADILRRRPRDYVHVRYTAGLMYHETLGRPLLAEPAFREVLSIGGTSAIEESARLHLADIYRQTGRLDEAQAALDATRRARPAIVANARYLYYQAMLQRARGQPLLALASLTLLAARADDSDRGWRHRHQLGAVHEELGEPAAAEASYRAAIAIVEALRREAGVPELRSYVLAERRAPYEALFALLARQARAVEALAVLEAMSGRAWLEQFLFRRGEAAPGFAGAVERAGAVEDLVPALELTPVAPASTGGAVIAAVGKRDVLAHVVAGERLWGVRIHDGALAVRDLAAWGEVARPLERFANDPDDRAAADRLGAVLVPVELVPPGDDPLYLLAPPELASLPYAALRRDGRYLVEDRSLAMLPSLSVLAHERQPGGAVPVVVGDPRGNLPGARREGEAVARRLGARLLVGGAATRQALAAAREAEVLHVAAHAGLGPQGAWLELADGPVSAARLLKLALRPRLAVLATCGSAASRDPERLGALAQAFLAGGAGSVLATTWVVEDEAVRPVVEAFYDEGGTTNPVQALARVQRNLARTMPPSRWAAFAVYGIGGSRRLGEAGGAR